MRKAAFILAILLICTPSLAIKKEKMRISGRDGHSLKDNHNRIWNTLCKNPT